MVLGKRKSPFIGVTENQDTPILYSRYNDVADLLLEPAARKPDVKSTKEEALGIHIDGEKQKKKPKREKVKKAPSMEEEVPKVNTKEEPVDNMANGVVKAEEGKEDMEVEPETKAAKKKNKKARAKARAAAAPSGPGNASEAQQIRSIMGIAPAGETQKSQPDSFSFGFAAALDSEGGDSAVAPVPEHEGEEAGGSALPPPPQTQGNTGMDARLRRVMGQDVGHVPRRVFVGGMPFSYDEEEVREYWSYCGEIENMDLMRFPDTNRFKGIAFITFADEAGYREALKVNGTMIDEVKVKVEPCMSAGPKGGKKPRTERSKDWTQHSSPAPKTPGYHVAYVGNLAFNANQEQLKGVFKGCEVKVIRLHTDKDTGKSKGYAHVHFADEDSLDRAVGFNGANLLGREIKVGYAQPKK